jgi:predicted transposase YbfD/YdcC
MFGELPDPRVERAQRHQLVDVVTIALCAVLCGADDWVGIETFGREKEDWLRSFLALPGGIPSHDTFGRIFARLDPGAFARCFRAWVAAVAPATVGQVALDGKTLRGAHDRRQGQEALRLVSAWAVESKLVLGQVAVAADSNEITAIPALLELLALDGCTVSIDAAGCQTAIAEQIVRQGADYVLTLKANHATLYEEVVSTFGLVRQPRFAHLVPHDYTRRVEKDHGRLEVRRVWTITDPASLDRMNGLAAWPQLRSVGMVEATRRRGETVEVETRYYLSSRPDTAARLGRAVRAHWGIENCLHWILDVAFAEDHNRTRVGHSAQNLAVLRTMALNILRRDPARGSIATKRFKAALTTTYLARLLAQL